MTLADVLQHGRDNTTCPYFTVRRMVRASRVAHLGLATLPVGVLLDP